MFHWKKLDCNPIITISEFDHPWMETHTQLAIPYVLKNGNIRIFFNSRTKGLTRPTFIDLDSELNIVYKNEYPLLDFGKPGTFDECGVMFSSILKMQDKLYMYYSGWNEPVSVRYHNSIGLAISDDYGETFQKFSEGPIMDRSIHNPIMTAGPYVIGREHDYIMYYLSCAEWIDGINGVEPVYDIHYAKSDDGIHWVIPENSTCIMGTNEAIAQPCVLFHDDLYHMWYSVRKTDDYRNNKDNSYRIGYAQSKDGIEWIRLDDKVGIHVSESGWDSEMIEYPYVIKQENTLLMFYNGNGFGQSGIGCAVAKLN